MAFNANDKCNAAAQLLQLIDDTRHIELNATFVKKLHDTHDILEQLQILSANLLYLGRHREAQAINNAFALSTAEPDFGGLGLTQGQALQSAEAGEVLFLVAAHLEALNSADREKTKSEPLSSRPSDRRGMTLSEKIFAFHDVEQRGELKPGDMCRVNVDWIMASEASWSSMESTYTKLGKPGIFRNDRFWLAGDHVVDPRINGIPKVKALIDASERAKKLFKMTEYQGMNYTIMHTEFFRQRAEPGMLVIGSDSHTCSSGALGCLSIGLGAADVTMPLVTGETWFKVPESVNIKLINEPSLGVGGKDVILYILQQLKRNTVAAERIVEFTGPGVQSLSCDARFAIANMTTEFGGITGVFVPDQVTHDFVQGRKDARYKSHSFYFQPDEDAVYVATYEIDLSKIVPSIALYPRPDDVVPVTDKEGVKLDGCFIGACTTAEEDIIMAGLVLEKGLEQGLRPSKEGKRKVVPGSRPILHHLRKTGLADVYERAGFEIGIPGCSYCVGMGADKAGVGEIWLSSQNRNFENRMGRGAIGNLASAITVAASSFDMCVTNPISLVKLVDQSRVQEVLGYRDTTEQTRETQKPTYVEPYSYRPAKTPAITKDEEVNALPASQNGKAEKDYSTRSADAMSGKVQVLGDFIDTDALAPAEVLVEAKTNEDLGIHCLEHTHPNFRQRVKDGFNIIVAGEAFGCGSSREQAVQALLGAGVQAVIAKSFAFIYARNQPALGLLGFSVSEPSFYELAVDGAEMTIDLAKNCVHVEGSEEVFEFQLSRMERQLNACGGITEAFSKWGRSLWEVMCTEKGGSALKEKAGDGGVHADLTW